MKIQPVRFLRFVFACTLVLSGNHNSVVAKDNRLIPLTPDYVRTAPMTIAASCVGVFANGHSWYLSVNSAGNAVLTIDTLPKRTNMEFRVSDEALSRLKEEIIKQDFFTLRDEYGEIVPDGSADAVTITVGEWTKNVRMHYLMNALQQKKRKLLSEVARAIRLDSLIRGWFNNPLAADSRPYSDRIIKFVQE